MVTGHETLITQKSYLETHHELPQQSHANPLGFFVKGVSHLTTLLLVQHRNQCIAKIRSALVTATFDGQIDGIGPFYQQLFRGQQVMKNGEYVVTGLVVTNLQNPGNFNQG